VGLGRVRLSDGSRFRLEVYRGAQRPETDANGERVNLFLLNIARADVNAGGTLKGDFAAGHQSDIGASLTHGPQDSPGPPIRWVLVFGEWPGIRHIGREFAALAPKKLIGAARPAWGLLPAGRNLTRSGAGRSRF